MPVVLFLSLALIVSTTLVHFELMRIIAALEARRILSRRVELLALVLSAFVAHLIGIGLYAAAFAWLHYDPGYGHLGGHIDESIADFFYFSLTCYTTIGFGDVHPVGELRIMAGLEGLNGLVLIAWSAALTFGAVQKMRRRRHRP
jgi:prepilin signal peptidase PulO-like enzyme (type II secretory pathway)